MMSWFAIFALIAADDVSAYRGEIRFKGSIDLGSIPDHKLKRYFEQGAAQGHLDCLYTKTQKLRAWFLSCFFDAFFRPKL